MSAPRVTVDDGVCLVVLDDPDRLNALGDEAMTGLMETFDRASSDPAIRVLVLTGAGDRAFCAGADIGLLRDLGSLADARAYIDRIRAVYVALEQLGKPTIAAVNGYALGGGFELCLACDLVLASDRASFATPEVRLGAIPGFATVRLADVVGRHKAAELMLLGDRIDAAEAAALGLVNRVVPAEDLLAEAHALARRLARGAPLAQQAITTNLRGSSRGADIALFVNTASAILATSDAKAGIRAFESKEEPRFDGA